MFNNVLLMGAASTGGAAAFVVDNSVRYNSPDSPYLYRTPTVAGNRMVGSISLWYKRSNLSTIMQLFNAGAGDDITFNVSNQLTFIDGSVSYITTQVFRDTSAWGHLLFAWDTTVTTAGDRLRIYHNGVEITAFATETNPAQFDLLEISNTVRQTIGANEGNTEEFDGYLSQVYLVDGAQLTPTDFGEFSGTNVWRPKEYSGGDTVTSWIDASGETLIGNLTVAGGLSAAWDGNPTKGYATCAAGDSPGTVGIDWGVGNTKTITRMISIGSSDYGYSSPGRTINIKLEGSTDNFSSSVVDLGGGTGDFIDATGTGSFKMVTPTSTTAYRYHRFYATSSVGSINVAQVFLYEEETGYGENGFKLDFADSADFGNDVSGLGNDYTSSGLAAADQVTDTPTNNFPTIMRNTSIVYMTEGNLQVGSISSITWHTLVTTLRLPSTGKWCCEIERINNGVAQLGYMGDTNSLTSFWGLNTQSALSNNYTSYYLGYGESASKVDGTNSSVGSLVSVANGGKLQMLLDQDAGTMTYYANGVLQKEWTGINTMAYVYLMLYGDNYGVPHCRIDFGQDGFTRVDEDYNYICTNNFPAPEILDGTKNFQPTLYTGDGSVRSIDQTGNSTFQPDFVWIKNRSAADDHMAIDAARGVTKQINPDGSDVEVTDVNGLTSFDSNGFGLGTGAGGYNDNLENFVAWQWKAGGGAGSANAIGSITTTTTTVNTVAGISIGTYVGTGVAATIGHGLGVIPKMIIVKNLGAVDSWVVYHFGNTTAPETEGLTLDTNGATADAATFWNDTLPTSSVFSVGTGGRTNQSTKTMVAYCFADVEGFSRFGNYIGNGNARGAPAILGFKPAYVMIKKTTGTGGWVIYDSQRSPINEIDDQLFADTTAAETTGSEEIDFTALGFQIRTADSDVNTSGGNYVYAAFAEHPFGGGVDITPATTF